VPGLRTNIELNPPKTPTLSSLTNSRAAASAAGSD